MDNIIYFEFNNWFFGLDFPEDEPYITWFKNDKNIIFKNENWVKENNLCVTISSIDDSLNFCITATKEWVEKKCPTLLNEYKRFIVKPNKNGDIVGRLGQPFLEYDIKNIGIKEV